MVHPTAAIWSAESISSWLYEIICGPPQPWRILTVYAHACNLENCGDVKRAVAALVSPRHGNGPFHVVAPAALFTTLTRGERVYLGDGLIRLPSGILDARSAECWSPRLPHAVSTPLASSLLHYLTLSLHEKLASELIPHPQQKMTILQQRASEGLAALQRGWQTCNLSQVANGARQLAGLGPGLTPAGDDLLVGWLAGLFFFGERCGLSQEAREVARAVVDAATSQTTRLSAAWLRFAGNGEFAEPWHQLVNGLNTGDPGAVERATQRILATGATSGQDALLGFRSAMQLFDSVC
jgi:hypothetical protein